MELTGCNLKGAQDMSPQEKLDYLKSLGFNLN
jgi:hypothetical protein